MINTTTSKCLNCNYTIVHNYCPACGQSKDVPKIDKNFILHDLKHGILHFDNSFLYTLLSLYKNPAEVIKNFIHGKRKHYANPFTLVFFLATLYSIVSLYFIQSKNVFAGNKIAEGIFHNQAWLILFLLPFISFLTYNFFKKSGYTYFEIMIYECFIQSKIVVINFLFLPLHYFFSGVSIVSILSYVFVGIVVIRAKVLFFEHYNFWQVLIKTVVTMILNLLFFCLLVFGITMLLT